MPATLASASTCRMRFRHSPTMPLTGLSSSAPRHSPKRRCCFLNVETIGGESCSASNASRASPACSASGTEWRHSLVKPLSSRAIGSAPPVVYGFQNLAWVARVDALPARAVRLLGAADAIHQATGRRTPASVRQDQETESTLLREALGDAAFETAWNEGRAMSVDQAVRYALEEIDVKPGGPPAWPS